jgi:hypothetical protein
VWRSSLYFMGAPDLIALINSDSSATICTCVG